MEGNSDLHFRDLQTSAQEVSLNSLHAHSVHTTRCHRSMEFETRSCKMVFDTINEMEGVRVAVALGINVGNDEVRHSL